MKSGYSGTLKLDRFGLNCKANKCSDAGTGDPGMLIIDETSPWFSVGDAGSTRPGLMPSQTAKCNSTASGKVMILRKEMQCAKE